LIGQQGKGVDKQTDSKGRGDFLKDIAVKSLVHQEIIAQAPAIFKTPSQSMGPALGEPV
jgi:hypothetical protein